MLDHLENTLDTALDVILDTNINTNQRLLLENFKLLRQTTPVLLDLPGALDGFIWSIQNADSATQVHIQQIEIGSLLNVLDLLKEERKIQIISNANLTWKSPSERAEYISLIDAALDDMYNPVISSIEARNIGVGVSRLLFELEDDWEDIKEAGSNVIKAISSIPGEMLADVFGENNCFSSHCKVSTDRGAIPITSVRSGDTVLSFDKKRALTFSTVTDILHNVTDTWLHLSTGTYVTPGHRYLRPDGSFMEIQDIVAGDGQIVSEDGSVVTVTAEIIRYSEETRHLFEEAEMLVYRTEVGLALAPEIKRGWK